MILSKEIINILNDLCVELGIYIDWGNPDLGNYLLSLMDRYINYEIIKSFIYLGIGILLFFIVYIMFKLLRKDSFLSEDEKSCPDGFYIAMVTFMVGLTFLGMYLFYTESSDLLKCFVFPELKTYEYVKKICNDSRESVIYLSDLFKSFSN